MKKYGSPCKFVGKRSPGSSQSSKKTLRPPIVMELISPISTDSDIKFISTNKLSTNRMIDIDLCDESDAQMIADHQESLSLMPLPLGLQLGFQYAI